MQKITPFLWFENQAAEAAELYTSLFEDSRVKSSSKLHDTPSGTVEIESIELFGQDFTLMSAGPPFKFNPSISFHVKCRTKDEVGAIWEKLSQGGKVLMEIGEYPFSEKYGWLEDKYGLSWQLNYTGGTGIGQRITPVLMFVGKVCGRAEEATEFYTSVFHDGKVDMAARYGKGEQPDKEGTLKYSSFRLDGQQFGAMDSARMHDFAFNEAISFVVNCRDQSEVDYYWERLSHDPKAEQCGWLKDKYGVSWQVVPTILGKLLQGEDTQKSRKVMEAMLQMKKIDISGLQQAYEME